MAWFESAVSTKICNSFHKVGAVTQKNGDAITVVVNMVQPVHKLEEFNDRRVRAGFRWMLRLHWSVMKRTPLNHHYAITFDSNETSFACQPCTNPVDPEAINNAPWLHECFSREHLIAYWSINRNTRTKSTEEEMIWLTEASQYVN